MAQKIIKIGSSVGITIPKETLSELGLSVGDKVRISVTQEGNGGRLSVEPEREAKIQELRPDVVVWTKSFVEKNRELLKRLAQK